MGKEIICLNGIGKAFSGVTVLKDIDLPIEEGKVYALAGENGAGKSTLCNIICGLFPPTEGTIRTEKGEVQGLTLDESKALGIRMVHQELQMLKDMSIAENIFVGNEVADKGWVNYRRMYSEAARILDIVGLKIDPRVPVRRVDIAAQQLIEIARAISAEARLIILDEPTSSLSDHEVEKLFSIIRENKAKGCSFIFISHRIEEILEVADDVIILKDGVHVKTLKASETTGDEIIRNMVGRDYEDFYNRKRTCFGEEILRVENLSGDPGKNNYSGAYAPNGISFSLHEGEVLGLAGLVGAGRTEIIKLLFGVDKALPGAEIVINGRKTVIRSPQDAMKQGIVWITEDRKSEGLVLDFPIRDNVALPNLDQVSRTGFVSRKKENRLTRIFMDKLRIKATGNGQIVRSLSGGNQQKVVIAKWLARQPKIFVMDEPTRGIDVGAKAEIYKLINELTASGSAVLLISSELPEIIGMSDRLLIMYEGRKMGELNREEFSEETIMRYAAGRESNHG